ncbi:MAG: acyltransferase family protein [Clostridium sp.]|uniref:acyltransferase family protein n=1 Tax=Clostridium sp. TaxID=1506 RepID=UPI003F3A0F96
MKVVLNRDFYFDTLKGFLIICVIVGNVIEYANPTNVNVHFFILFLYMFHMPLFTFVSGYFSKKSKRTTREKVVHTLKIYVFIQIFYVIFTNLLLNGSYTVTLVFPQWTFWYLLTLMWLYIIEDYIKNKKLWLICSILLSLLIGFDTSIGTTGSFSRTFFFLPFFIAGLMFEKKHIEILKAKRTLLLISSVIILWILYTFNYLIPIDMLFEYTNYKYFTDFTLFPLCIRIFHYIGAFIIGAFVLSIIPKKRYYISEIGRNSLYMYLVHAFTIYIIFPILYFNTVPQIILASIVTVLSCILTSKIPVYAIKFYKTSNIKLKIDNLIKKDKKISS